jgi:hypothetical protein
MCIFQLGLVTEISVVARIAKQSHTQAESHPRNNKTYSRKAMATLRSVDDNIEKHRPHEWLPSGDFQFVL